VSRSLSWPRGSQAIYAPVESLTEGREAQTRERGTERERGRERQRRGEREGEREGGRSRIILFPYQRVGSSVFIKSRHEGRAN
jgi:hypothetical protein